MKLENLDFKNSKENSYNRRKVKIRTSILNESSFNFVGNNLRLNNKNLKRFEKSFIIDKNLNSSFPKKKLFSSNIEDTNTNLKYSSIFEKKNTNDNKFLYNLSDIMFKITNQFKKLIKKFQFKNSENINLNYNELNANNYDKLKINISKSNIKTKFDTIEQIISYFKSKLKKFKFDDSYNTNNIVYIKLIDNIFNSFWSIEKQKNKSKANFIYDLFYLFFIFNKKNYEKISDDIKKLKNKLKKKFNTEKSEIINNLDKILLENIKLKRKQKDFDNFPKKLKNLFNTIDTQFFNMNDKITILRRENEKYLKNIKDFRDDFEIINSKLYNIKEIFNDSEFDKNNFNIKNKTNNSVINIVDELLVYIDRSNCQNYFKLDKFNHNENFIKEYNNKVFNFNTDNIFKDTYIFHNNNISTQDNIKPLTLNASVGNTYNLKSIGTQVNFVRYYFLNKGKNFNKTQIIKNNIQENKNITYLSNSSNSIKDLDFTFNKKLFVKKEKIVQFNPEKLVHIKNRKVIKNKTLNLDDLKPNNSIFNNDLPDKKKKTKIIKKLNSKMNNKIEKYCSKSYFEYVKKYLENINYFNKYIIANDFINLNLLNINLIISNLNFNSIIDNNYYKDACTTMFERYKIKYLKFCTKIILEKNNKNDLFILFINYFKNKYTSSSLANKYFFIFISFIKDNRNNNLLKLIFLLLQKDNLKMYIIYNKIFDVLNDTLHQNNLNLKNFYNLNKNTKTKNVINKIILNIKLFLDENFNKKFKEKIEIESLKVENHLDWKNFNLELFLINLINELKNNIYFKILHIFNSFDTDSLNYIKSELFNTYLKIIDAKLQVQENLNLQNFWEFININFSLEEKLFNYLENKSLSNNTCNKVFDFYFLKLIFKDKLYNSYKNIIIEEIEDMNLLEKWEFIKNKLNIENYELFSNKIWCIFKIIEHRLNMHFNGN